MAEVKWIKITTDMFDDEKIKIIQALPEGDAILVIWVRLIILAGKTNNSGYVYINENLPYTEDTLSIIFNKPLSIIKLALQTFESLNMIEQSNNGIYLINFEKYQNIEGLDRIREQTRKRVAKFREKQKMLPEDDSNVTVTLRNAIDKEKNKNKNKNIEIDNRTAVIRCYEDNIGLITPAVADLLFSYEEEMDTGLICKAIEIATINNKRSMNYINGILKSWNNKGYRHLADIQEENKKEVSLEDEVKRFEEVLKQNGY